MNRPEFFFDSGVVGPAIPNIGPRFAAYALQEKLACLGVSPWQGVILRSPSLPPVEEEGFVTVCDDQIFPPESGEARDEYLRLLNYWHEQVKHHWETQPCLTEDRS